MSGPAPLRIALFHNRYLQRGGEDTAVEAETEHLAKAGHRVERCIVENRDAVEGRRFGALRTGLRAHWNPASAGRVDALLRDGPVDVALIHNFFPVLSPALHVALFERGIPVLQTIHNYRLLCANGSLLRDGRVCEECTTQGPWHALRFGCYRGSRPQTAVWAHATAHHRARGTWGRCVDRFLAPTAFLRRKLVGAGLPEERVEVVPYLVEDPGEAAPPGAGAVFVGRLSPEKGVDLLIDAWREQDGAPLTIVGSGPSEAALRERASGVPGIRFTGSLDRAGVLRALRDAAFAVVPSRWYEISPFAALEAFACGRAVVGWRGGALRELMVEGESGLLFDELTPASVAAACRRLLGDGELTRRLGAGARERYLERHAPPVALAQRERLCRTVIEERRQRRTRA